MAGGSRPSRRAPRVVGTLIVKLQVTQPRGRAGQGGGRAAAAQQVPAAATRSAQRASRADSGPERDSAAGKWLHATGSGAETPQGECGCELGPEICPCLGGISGRPQGRTPWKCRATKTIARKKGRTGALGASFRAEDKV